MHQDPYDNSGVYMMYLYIRNIGSLYYYNINKVQILLSGSAPILYYYADPFYELEIL